MCVCVCVCVHEAGYVDYLGLHSLALPVFGSFRYLTLACKHL